MVGWKLTRHQKQTQINEDDIRENRNRFYHDYNVGDKVILTNHIAYKY